MYKYLLFDLDETLLDFKKAEAVAITETLKSFGIKATRETVELYSAINLSCWKRYEKGEITRDEIYKNRVELLGESLGVAFDADSFTNKYSALLSHQGHLYPYAISLLKQLKATAYKMAAATNGSFVAQTGRLIASGIAGFFDCGIYISEKIGFKKPDPKFFEFILQSAEIENKSDVLVIGDSLSSDIAGAVAAGLDCCFVGTKATEEPKITPTYSVNALEDIISVCGL